MLLVKPLSLGMSFRPMEHRKRFGLCVSSYLHVPFSQGSGGTLWGEQSMWDFLAREMAVPLIDEGIAKLTPEFLLHGSAYSDPSRPEAVAVRARIGNLEKTLLVFGDRKWDGNRAGAPQAFSRMPLTWDRAFGGAGYPENPQGIGLDRSKDGGRMPNLELPSSRLVDPGQAIVPAGFGALDPSHPQRAALRGTYDENWLRDHAPGFAPDLSWKHFNMARSDQWFDGPLRGDESFAFENLHPEHRLIEGRLPGLRVRVFARRRSGTEPGAGPKLREVSMRLSTLWCFPHAERLVLVFHGLAETGEDDASDIDLLLGVVERLEPDSTRGDEHYLAAIERRTQGPDAPLHWLDDSDLVPSGLDTVDPSLEKLQQSLKPAGLREDAAWRKAHTDLLAARNLVRVRGKDPDALGLTLPERTPPPSPAQLPAAIRQAQAQAEAQQWRSIERAVGDLEKIKQAVSEGRIDPADLVHRGPPDLQTDTTLARLEKAHARAGKPFERAKLLGMVLQAEASQKAGYLLGAHLQAPAPRLQGPARDKARREAEWLLSQGVKTWTGFDFTGADLSGLDLRDLDLSGAWLESADLSNCNLSRARLHGAVLAHASLRAVVAVDTDFSGANLGGARIEGALLDRANLCGATLMKTILSRCELRSARIEHANLLESLWEDVDLSRAVLTGTTLHELDLRSVRFDEATLAGCALIECNLGGADFSGVNAMGSSFTGCNAAAASFAGARLSGAAFVGGTIVSAADFSKADLSGANLGGSDATGAKMGGATLDGANLCDCRLDGADLRHSRARGALLRKASLRAARLGRADFKDAILQKADLRGADLADAHLFGADLSRAYLDADTRIDGAILERARIYPRQPVKAS